MNNAIPSKVLEIIKARGIRDEDLEEFLAPKPRLAYDPFLLSNMRKGVDLLLKNIDEDKNIVIYGDYDVDGITSTALLMKVLSCLTDKVNYYIPSRIDEGYGLNMDAIDRIKASGGEFIVTVDCGSVSKEETAYAHSLGIETLVTDHHNISDVTAEGIVINPRLPEDGYPFKGLAGVGVAYKLALAISRIREIPKSVMAEMVELATVGTIADIMPMLDENRTIVKVGLRSIHLGCRNKGLRELIDRSSLDYKTLKASDISFGIAPKINASGRMGDATLGVRLLLSDDEQEIRDCCNALLDANRERRRLQDEAFKKGLSMVDSEMDKGDFLILEINDSHEGVLGIVAGRIREQVNRPVVVVSRGDGTYKGTGRSIPGVDLFSMLDKYRSEFISFGGHSAACGFTIEADKIDRLKENLNNDMAEASKANPDILEFNYDYDADIGSEDIDIGLAEALELLEPCGKENEMPMFLVRNAHITGWRFLRDEDKMAKFSIRREDGTYIDAVIFSGAADAYEEVSRGPVDVIGSIEKNVWRDEAKVQVVVRHILPGGSL
ncbi:MAG: single-stranded-DNA-specific exonuclease RecJ [Mogibacterium sp.]|nr:single-stranded-DNA-specific exonuclease RecJ [Mogibacterium sp.]